MDFRTLRKNYHERICLEIIRISPNPKKSWEYPNFADGTNKNSVDIANGIVSRLEYATNTEVLAGQAAGGKFEEITRAYLCTAFQLIQHLSPGDYRYSTHLPISAFEQYEHLAQLQRLLDKLVKDNDEENNQLATAIGREYIITPDIVVGRWPISDAQINERGTILYGDDGLARLTPIRDTNSPSDKPRVILHASISCKWTLRSDRSQNARTEALNLIRNRKGSAPKIVVVTGEPLPTRISSLAFGTGDLDCVYHFALEEMIATIRELRQNESAGIEEQWDILSALLNGKRLRDISDLPFDLIA